MQPSDVTNYGLRPCIVLGQLSAALCSLVPELSLFQGIQNSLMSIRRHTNIHIDITWRDKVNGTRCFKTVIQYRGNWSACETVREDLIRTAFVLCGPDGDCHPREVDNIRGFRPGVSDTFAVFLDIRPSVTYDAAM